MMTNKEINQAMADRLTKDLLPFLAPGAKVEVNPGRAMDDDYEVGVLREFVIILPDGKTFTVDNDPSWWVGE
jgi:hypothetical protein